MEFRQTLTGALLLALSALIAVTPPPVRAEQVPELLAKEAASGADGSNLTAAERWALVG